MTNENTNRAAPTRRTYLKYGGAVVGGGLLAGCASDSDSEGKGTETTNADATQTTSSDATTESDGGESGPYSVTMSPMGTVEFESVPANVMVYSLLYADMAVAYGHGDAVNSLGFDSDAGGNTLDAYYKRLDGVSFGREGLTQLNTGSGGVNIDKELFYELDSDLHMVDPALVLSFDGWKKSDIDEIEEKIAPWFGNTYSRQHSQPPKAYRDNYEYYTLWEIAEKVAAVFRERERYEALASVHDDLLERIESNLPPKNERPTVGSVIFMEGTFYPSKINTEGFANAHVRPLGATDAFAEGEVTYQTAYDFETMLKVDPDVILHTFGVASYYDVAQIRKTLADHPVGSKLTAVKNDAVYPSGNPVQGPLMNLFQLEMTAKQLYPEQFGEWPEYENGDPYPEIPEDERLFDRQRVADIVTGTN
ncbi:ABC transporter substrate-binding protein [Haladaptatus sp. CMAA 1909]|uniref:ABC transporter substrate-binding protein n=1 Tax=Haladaptatus sp. CMAA 1909 TaxID=3368986 RepID=UPI00375503F6